METGEVLKGFALTLVSAQIPDFPFDGTLSPRVMDDLDAPVVTVWMAVNMADPTAADQETVVEIENVSFFHIMTTG